MQKIAFSSDQLPAHLSATQRFGLLRDLYCASVFDIDYGISDRPFRARMEFARLGQVWLGHMSGTIVRGEHRKAGASSRTHDQLGLLINTGDASIQLRSRNRESVIGPGCAALASPLEAQEFTSSDDHSAWMLLNLPRRAVLRATPRAEDLVGTVLRADNEALRMIRGYAEITMHNRPVDPRFDEHGERTFTDLVALALGGEKDAVAIASQRGLKAARLESILQAIADGYHDPEFSVARVAHKLRVSERYVQDVLHGTGQSFSERVMELRLQHAAGLLARTADRNRKVSDVAFSSGFNDLSYFHRSYRRRFGVTPAGAGTLSVRLSQEAEATRS